MQVLLGYVQKAPSLACIDITKIKQSIRLTISFVFWTDCKHILIKMTVTNIIKAS